MTDFDDKMAELRQRFVDRCPAWLGDLDAAQRSYEESLELDPSSDVAQNELEYIRQKRARQVTPD